MLILRGVGSGCGDDGAVALASMLHVNGTLVDLHLSSNSIGPRGAVAIADALKTMASLGSFELFDIIGDEGAVALADALRSCARLKHLSLCTTLVAHGVKCSHVLCSF